MVAPAEIIAAFEDLYARLLELDGRAGHLAVAPVEDATADDDAVDAAAARHDRAWAGRAKGRAVAIADHLAAQSGGPEWRRFVEIHAERIERGGARMLLQGALAGPSAHEVTLAAEEWRKGRTDLAPYLRLLNRPTGRGPTPPLETYAGPAGSALAVDGEGRRFVTAGGAKIAFFVRGTPAPAKIVATTHRGPVVSLVFAGPRAFTGCRFDGEGAPDGRALAFDAATGKRLTRYDFKGEAEGAFLDLAKDGRLLLAAGGPLRVWPVSEDGKAAGNGRTVKPLWTSKARYDSAAFHPTEPWIVAYGDGHVVILAASDGAEVRRFPVFPSEPARGLGRPALFRDGVRSLWAFEGADGFAEIDLSAGKLTGWITGHGNDVESISLSHDESRALTASQDGTFRIWDLSSGDCVHAQRQGNAVAACAFVDGEAHVLATSLDGRTCVWSTTPATPEAEPRDAGALDSLAFSRDGTRILALAKDGPPTLWNSEDGSLVATLAFEGSGAIVHVALKADGDAWALLHRNATHVTYAEVSTGAFRETVPVTTTPGRWTDATGLRVLALGDLPFEVLARHEGCALLSAGYDGISVLRGDDGAVAQEAIRKPSAWPYASRLVVDGEGAAARRFVATVSHAGVLYVYDFQERGLPKELAFPIHRELVLQSGSATGITAAPGTGTLYFYGIDRLVRRAVLTEPTLRARSVLLAAEAIFGLDVHADGTLVLAARRQLVVHAGAGARELSFEYADPAPPQKAVHLRVVGERRIVALHAGRLYVFAIEGTPGVTPEAAGAA